MIHDEKSGNRLVGTYRGIVLKHLPHGRCKVFVPGVYAPEFKSNPDLLPSAQPKTPLFAGTNKGNGVFSYPNLSSIVWCTFMNGDANLPVFDSATLGGENAFGQYELIKRKDEPVSERHMITSGKTHMLWYENGKLSGIVEDPIRTYCSVDYDQFELENNNTSVENKYSYQISNEILRKISKNEISNINCQYVLDNNANAHGELSTSTHWYNILDIELSDEQYSCKGAISTDNRNIMNNNGIIDVGTISSYSAFETDKKNSFTKSTDSKVNNGFSYVVPGEYQTHVKKHTKTDYKSSSASSQKSEKEEISACTYNIQDVSADVVFDAMSIRKYNLSDATAAKQITLTTDIDNRISHVGRGDLELSSHLKETIISADGASGQAYTKNLDSIADLLATTESKAKLETVSSLNLIDMKGGAGVTTNVQLTNTYEMDNDGSVHYGTKKKETTAKTAGTNEILRVKAQSEAWLDVTGKSFLKSSHYKFHSIDDTPIEIDNKSTIGMENKTESKMEFTAIGNTKIKGSPVVDAQYKNIINTTTSTANIQIVDNIVNKECVNNMNAKLGLTEIRITNKGSGMHCTIRMDAEGKMTIDTTDSLAITTTNTVTVDTQSTTVTSPTVTIIGNTTIDGTLKVTGATDITNTLHVSGATTIDADAQIGGKSFLGHMHIGNMGAPTSPPV